MVGLGVGILLAIELSDRRDEDAALEAAYLDNVALIEASTRLTEEQKSTFVDALGDPPEVLSDADYTFQYILFAFSIISTIGYGNISPLNSTSRWFCVVYALIGIPFTLLLLSISVEKVLIPVNGLLSLMNSRMGHLYSPFHIRFKYCFSQNSSNPDPPSTVDLCPP